MATKRTQPEITVPMSERAAYSPTEFAALFGKAQTWGYRQIYAGRVKVIKQMGRTLIPRSEVDRIQKSAEVMS